MDYISRMEDDPENFVRFDKGEDVAYCRITIIDDSLYEPEEQFQVKLTMPMGGRIGTPASVNVVIAPDADDGKLGAGALFSLVQIISTKSALN